MALDLNVASCSQCNFTSFSNLNSVLKKRKSVPPWLDKRMLGKSNEKSPVLTLYFQLKSGYQSIALFVVVLLRTCVQTGIYP